MSNNGFKAKCKAFLKRNRMMYRIYFYIMSFLVNALKVFLKSDDKLILFVSYGGRRCADSPRAIYDMMLSDTRFKNYKLVWGVINTDDFPDIANKVKMDSFRYFKTALKARCWITNVLIERALDFEGKNTFYLYTGHGSPIKKCGNDEHNSKHFNTLSKSHFNASLAQSELEMDVRSRNLNIDRRHIYMTGTPANDILVSYTNEYRLNIRRQLGISENKKAILYAPTFREYNSLGTFECNDVDFVKWHSYLGDDFVILYRAHPISISTEKENNEWFIDVTGYNSIEPLMIASDMLVSDYSGLIADYSILHFPIYLWLYDYEQYEEARGLYFDLREVLPFAIEESDLLDLLKGGYNEYQKQQLAKFQEKYAPVYGTATKKAIELIFDNIQ